MQFVSHGPDVPEPLIRAHEDGRVIFFCGAGISYPANLPGFDGLVKNIYAALGTSPEPMEADAIKRQQFDAALDLLERRVPGQRLAVRSHLPAVLKPNLRKKGATTTHSSLLTLAKARDGAVRLVTTNFDRIFEKVIRRDKLPVPSYPAPLLPIPKNSRWNGLVYLHGVLPAKHDDSALQRLVVTSGDFGLAYLTERWAARFVSELFRNYVVCFVGYSINDPVLRYMMDALAADKLQGEVAPVAYAFGDFSPGHKAHKEVEWAAKGVEPILYEVPTPLDHSALHRTLKAWADTYRDGVLGKERIVVDHAMSRPTASTSEDDFVGRLLWALCDPNGLPAKRFAELNPVPTLDWLEPLCESRYKHNDLVRFGVPPLVKPDQKLAFSLAQRPSPYTHAPWMTLLNPSGASSRWDEVMIQIARWLVRHLGDPKLVLWVARGSGRLHDQFCWLIDQELRKIEKFERGGRTAELDALRASSANAIPDANLRSIWRLILGGYAEQSGSREFYAWRERFTLHGLTATIRMELRALLTPRVTLRAPFSWPAGAEEDQNKAPIDWELSLTGEHLRSSLKELSETDAWKNALPSLFDDSRQLLVDALQIMRELGGATDKDDRSFWDLPSITPHWQNRGFRDWVVLIEIQRDSWISILAANPAKAAAIALEWWAMPYPTFKRLALFAACYGLEGFQNGWIEWLKEDACWWLWSVETQREVLRLFVLRGRSLSDIEQASLEKIILRGSPRSLFREETTDDEFARLSDRNIWLRLAKLQTVRELTPIGQRRLTAIQEAYPQWVLSSNERDEFSHWMSGTGDPDYEDERQIENAPRVLPELTKWLTREVKSDLWHEDDWRDLVRTEFGLALRALKEVARSNQWPVERWRTAFQTWGDGPRARHSWCFVYTLVDQMPDAIALQLAHSLTSWISAVAKHAVGRKGDIVRLCARLLALPYDDTQGRANHVNEAINHPVGHLTQALLNYWFAHKPKDGQLLPTDLKDVFSNICLPSIARYRHGRVLLAANVIALFRVDPEWTRASLLPLFSWGANLAETVGIWQGHLWAARLYRPLIEAIKPSFLATAAHCGELGEARKQYVALLAYAALDKGDSFTWSELASATASLRADDLEETAFALARALEGAGTQREEYWDNRIKPYWHNLWPKTRALLSQKISEKLARLCVAAGGAFPDAVETVSAWLQPLEHSHYILSQLGKVSHSHDFPQSALRFLSLIVNEDDRWPGPELARQLDLILAAWPGAAADDRYRRLDSLLRRS